MKQNKPSSVFLNSWETPEKTQQTTRIGFTEQYPSNISCFIVVDAYTKLVKEIETKTTISEWCIKTLRKLFSALGFLLFQYLIMDHNLHHTFSNTFQNIVKLLLIFSEISNCTGKSSYELMFGRNIRTRLDVMLPIISKI